MTNLQLRDALPDDQAAIAEVTLAAYEQYSSMMGPIWPLYKQNIVETLADPKPAEQIVAEQDGRIVGMVLLYPGGTAFNNVPGVEADSLPKSSEVRLLAVAPTARGKGVGRALMQVCIERAIKSGVKDLILHTSEIMATAMALYERMGFVRAPELDFIPAPGITIKGYRFNFDDSAAG